MDGKVHPVLDEWAQSDARQTDTETAWPRHVTTTKGDNLRDTGPGTLRDGLWTDVNG